MMYFTLQNITLAFGDHFILPNSSFTRQKYFKRQMTSRPKGVRAMRANLKCCFPNGIPIIVM